MDEELIEFLKESAPYHPHLHLDEVANRLEELIAKNTRLKEENQLLASTLSSVLEEVKQFHESI